MIILVFLSHVLPFIIGIAAIGYFVSALVKQIVSPRPPKE